MVEGQLIIVSGEEDILVSCLSSTPYVDTVEESLETSFQALEVVARVMLGLGYKPGMGLGRNGDGMVSLAKFKENHGRFRLGYKPTRVDVRRSALERRGRSMG